MNEFCQVHATIPTHSNSLLEVREQLAVFMANQEKLGIGPEEQHSCASSATPFSIW